MIDATREYWEGQAADFDREADHGLLDPGVRRAWAELILPLIPLPGSEVADLGCGTGSLSVLLTPGTMLLVEGLWGAGAGIPSGTCQDLVLRYRRHADVVPLTDPALWGKEISDERYLVISRS